MDEVSILIPTRYDSLLVIDLCLRSIRKYTEHPYRIIVGDAGVDEETADFLKRQSDISVVRCPDPLRPKNHLSRVVETPFFVFLHDDAQIMKSGWLKRRLEVMNRDPMIGFVGPVGFNGSDLGWKQYLPFSPLVRRFFPFSLLVRTETQTNLDLYWGKLGGFDNGAIAYLQYKKRWLIPGDTRKKWKFKHYSYSPDVKHWKGMTWPLRKVEMHGEVSDDVKIRLQERDAKMEAIRKILEDESY